MDLRDRATTIVRDLPVAHRVVIGGVIVAVALGAAAFLRWVSTPSYTVLYSGLEPAAVSEVITELESMGVPYELEAGGTTVTVPQARVFDVRAKMAGAGIATTTGPQGYELLDGQSLTISDFKQRVDFKRAVEGELARTLTAMDGVDSAQVHLVIPEDRLFGESKTATASVLVDPRRQLNVDEIETITFLVSSAVEGLEPADVTVADTAGRALNAPGGAVGASGVTNRNLRMTDEFESALAGDIERLLDSAVGVGRASVVVNAKLDFDERETETETFNPDSQVALREQTIDEEYTGAGSPPGGTVGVDGDADLSGSVETDYSRTEVVREYGVDRVIDRATSAPGDVEKLSVAIVMDDGSLSGVAVPEAAEIQRLVTAAVGLDEERGDTIAVTTVPLPAAEDADGATDAGGSVAQLVDTVPQIIGGVAVIAVALYLLNLARRKQDDEEELARWFPPVALEGETMAETVPAGVRGGATAPLDAGSSSVADLVERQPEEIAELLRSWMAEEQVR